MEKEPHDSTFIVEVRVLKQQPKDDRNQRKEIAREPSSPQSDESTACC